MDPTLESDADILWRDVLTLLAERDVPAANLAMIRSCQATAFDGDTLTISTNMGFAQKKIKQQAPLIEECLEQAAFQPVHLEVALSHTREHAPIETKTEMTREEIRQANLVAQEGISSSTDGVTVGTGGVVSAAGDAGGRASGKTTHARTATSIGEQSSFVNESLSASDSKLTFGRFVAGDENMLAYEAAKQVANGENKSYNPLFIYGKSGLGKTHLLRAIQNYIVENDPSRLCVYRTSTEFINDYVEAMKNEEASAGAVLARDYQNVDVLIIDDIQNMRRAARTIEFFFDTFNALASKGRQIVLAADRAPSQLGMGDSKFDERETSRMDSGVTVSIQVPDYELKLKLINNFYERMKQDAEAEHIAGLTANISDDMRRLMAERSGTNIRVIEGFVQTCLMTAHGKERKGEELGREDILRISQAKWPSGQKILTIEQIQKAVEGYYDVAHTDLVGSKRNKELMEPRHVAIWLTRELTDNTLADIGKKFGGRSHATVKHSIYWVERTSKEDRIFQDRVQTLKDNITDTS
ncbi:MAG: chromosomal replication initiator protein DnaA [Olsenella sp.]|nr:chromosomal replication initiator protein DnaA [Olsenella sp.]